MSVFSRDWAPCPKDSVLYRKSHIPPFSWQTTVEKIRRFKESRSNNPSFGADHSAPKTMDDFLSFLRLRKKPVQPSSLQEPYRLRDDSSPPHPESALGSDASSSVVSFIRQGLKLGMAVANSSSANDGKKRAIRLSIPPRSGLAI